MTKADYSKTFIPHEEWLKVHVKYVKMQLDNLRPWFNVDQFINDHIHLATKQVLETLIADVAEHYNSSLGELENYLSRWLCISYEEVVEYRTQKFWDEIKLER